MQYTTLLLYLCAALLGSNSDPTKCPYRDAVGVFFYPNISEGKKSKRKTKIIIQC